jgi:hypothetical protein
MASFPGFRGQRTKDVLFDASGTVTAGGTSQLVLPAGISRSFLFVENLSSTLTLYYEIGAAFATATITNGAVTSLTIVNGGFGFTVAPTVQFLGGGSGGGFLRTSAGLPDYPSPGTAIGNGNSVVLNDRPAKARAVLTGGVITSFVIDDPGQGYLNAPYVYITNDASDPRGCADPFYGSTARGMALLPFGSQTYETNYIATEPLAVYSTTTGHRFTAKYFAG